MEMYLRKLSTVLPPHVQYLFSVTSNNQKKAKRSQQKTDPTQPSFESTQVNASLCTHIRHSLPFHSSFRFVLRSVRTDALKERWLREREKRELRLLLATKSSSNWMLAYVIRACSTVYLLTVSARIYTTKKTQFMAAACSVTATRFGILGEDATTPKLLPERGSSREWCVPSSSSKSNCLSHTICPT